MSTLLEDVRFAVRILRKTPGFTTVAILTLALAIGANTALFSVVNAVVLRPLPFPQPERLFQVVRRHVSGTSPSLTVPQFSFLAGQSQPFAHLTAYPSLNAGFNLTGDGLPERVPGTRATASFFDVLGVRPALGRGFVPEEDVPSGPRVVVLGHGLWQRRFGGTPDILGRSLQLNGEGYTIVGVAPPGFRYPVDSQLWTPLQLDRTNTEDAHYLTVVGRVNPGVAPEQAASLVALQGEQLRATRVGVLSPESRMDAEGLQARTASFALPALLMLLGASGLVLLIACVNLANLQLARAATRERELAVRTALGASPSRLLRQLLTESLLLSGLGGLAGLLLATWSIPALLMLAPEGLPIPEGVTIDGTVLAFTLGVSVLTGLVFGLLPALKASRPDLQDSLKVSASRAAGGPGSQRTRRLLVVGEVALAVILLIGAALLVKSFAALIGTAPGIDTRGVLTMKLSLPEARYGTPASLESFIWKVEERLRALPGVQAVGFATTLPFEDGSDMGFTIEGRDPGPGGKDAEGVADYRPVTAGYFQALKIGLVRGRLLTDVDRHESAPVVIINETAARRYWPGQDPLGQRITIGKELAQLGDTAPREIIGVVRDVRENGVQRDAPPILYLPPGQMPAQLTTMMVRLLPQSFVVRTPGDITPFVKSVPREIQAVDSLQPVTHLQPMEDILSRSLGSQRFNMTLLGLMAGLALVLAAVGIYGVLSYLVNQRTRELGVRLALGATRGEVVRLILRQGLSPVGLGLVLGVAGAAGLTRLISSLLYGVEALDVSVFLLAPVGLVGVALVAMWLPARRASRVDPMVALRYD
ncbi:ABC transporter permease [Archangium violaceum]|uniref:ABC transporter permease n=1 Tax=Archangium violaceum TaxID=83451 RepID=UPI002B2CA2E7|nr:ABC transporter permease [Archangium gephyra]